MSCLQCGGGGWPEVNSALISGLLGCVVDRLACQPAKMWNEKSCRKCSQVKFLKSCASPPPTVDYFWGAVQLHRWPREETESVSLIMFKVCGGRARFWISFVKFNVVYCYCRMLFYCLYLSANLFKFPLWPLKELPFISLFCFVCFFSRDLQDPFPWEQRVSFAKSIASGMVRWPLAKTY